MAKTIRYTRAENPRRPFDIRRGPGSLRRGPPPVWNGGGPCQLYGLFGERGPFVPVAGEGDPEPEGPRSVGVVRIERRRFFRLDQNPLRLACGVVSLSGVELSAAVQGREIAGAQGRLQLSIREMGALFDARLFRRKSPAPNSLHRDNTGKRLPHVSVGGLFLRRGFQAFASAGDGVRLLISRKPFKDATPGRFLDVARARKASARRPGSPRSTTLPRAPRSPPRQARC